MHVLVNKILFFIFRYIFQFLKYTLQVIEIFNRLITFLEQLIHQWQYPQVNIRVKGKR
jgi:hypothetical protein